MNRHFFRYPLESFGAWALIFACLLGHDEEEEGDGDEGVDENDEPVHER